MSEISTFPTSLVNWPLVRQRSGMRMVGLTEALDQDRCRKTNGIHCLCLWGVGHWKPETTCMGLDLQLLTTATTANQLFLPQPRLTAEFSSALVPASQGLQCANAASDILSTEPGHWVPELHFQGPCPLLPKDRESQRRTQKRVSPATHGPGAFPPWHLCMDYYMPLFKHMSCFPGKSAKIGSQFNWFRGSWASKFSNIYTLPTILNCMPYFFKSTGQKQEDSTGQSNE